MTKGKIIFSTIQLFAVFIGLGQNYVPIVDAQFVHSNEDDVPGFSIAVIEGDAAPWIRSYGVSDMRSKRKLDQNTPLAIASCSKQFTAYCILLLEEEGKLKISDNVIKYIPELSTYSSEIKIKHLLSHSSGIRDHIVMLGWENRQKEKYYNFEGTLEALSQFERLSFEPGEDFAYSNTGYVLLALIIERVSGMDFTEFASQRIFEPIGMSHTEFSFRRNTGSFNPYNYNWSKGKFHKFNHHEVNAMGATGIYTTIADFMKWDLFLHNPPEDKKSVVERLFISDTLTNGQTLNYNNGFKHRQFKGFQIIEHAGGWANYNFQYTIIPELGIRFIIGANNDYYYPIGIAEELLKTIIPEELLSFTHDASSTANIPAPFQNQYICQDFSSCGIEYLEDLYAITGKNLYGANEYPLLISKNEIIMDSVGNHLVLNPVDTSFVWYGGSYFNTPRTFEINPTIDSTQLIGYSGVFYSDELGQLKVKYNLKKGTFKIKASFGANPKVQSQENRLLRTNKDYDLIFIDENTILLGNSRVRVEFKKQR